MSDNASVSDVWRSVSAGDRPGGGEVFGMCKGAMLHW